MNGRSVPLAAATHPDSWASTARVFLPQGVNELTVTAPRRRSRRRRDHAAWRDAEGVGRRPANVFRSEAEALPRAGTAVVQTAPAGSNGSADASGVVRDVGYLGNGAGNTLTVPRPAGFTPAPTSWCSARPTPTRRRRSTTTRR